MKSWLIVTAVFLLVSAAVAGENGNGAVKVEVELKEGTLTVFFTNALDVPICLNLQENGWILGDILVGVGDDSLGWYSVTHSSPLLCYILGPSGKGSPSTFTLAKTVKLPEKWKPYANDLKNFRFSIFHSALPLSEVSGGSRLGEIQNRFDAVLQTTIISPTGR